MALKLETYFQKCGLDRRENAQQSVHLTLGILRTSQAVFHALSFFWLDGLPVPHTSADTANPWDAPCTIKIYEKYCLVPYSRY